MKSYKIENVSGCLQILGLYPGESKFIEDLTPDIKLLINKGMISIIGVKETKTTKNSVINTAVVAEKVDTAETSNLTTDSNDNKN